MREYTDLVRQGDGSERERLALLRRHQADVIAKIATLTESLDVIIYKVGVYEDIIDQSGAHPSRSA